MGCERDGYEKAEYMGQGNIKKDIRSCGGTRNVKNKN
jgi:hypothetical protein